MNEFTLKMSSYCEQRTLKGNGRLHQTKDVSSLILLIKLWTKLEKWKFTGALDRIS